jgi:aminomethyltransferase
MVPFAGYLMPVSYEGINAEHETVPSKVWVCLMFRIWGEFILKGSDALDLIQRVTSNDASSSPMGSSILLSTNDAGGIVDDLLVYRIDEKTYMLGGESLPISKRTGTGSGSSITIK